VPLTDIVPRLSVPLPVTVIASVPNDPPLALKTSVCAPSGTLEIEKFPDESVTAERYVDETAAVTPGIAASVDEFLMVPVIVAVPGRLLGLDDPPPPPPPQPARKTTIKPAAVAIKALRVIKIFSPPRLSPHSP
jgi:hypothetical protein